MDEAHTDHGNSPAAWTAVAIMIVGSIVVAASFPLISVGVAVLGVLIIVLGAVVGKIMAMAGYGSPPSYTVESPSPSKFEGPTMGSEEKAQEADRASSSTHRPYPE
jgi:hypothetical protein